MLRHITANEYCVEARLYCHTVEQIKILVKVNTAGH